MIKHFMHHAEALAYIPCVSEDRHQNFSLQNDYSIFIFLISSDFFSAAFLMLSYPLCRF